eukprot:2337023-Prymnesium_polylepis.2
MSPAHTPGGVSSDGLDARPLFSVGRAVGRAYHFVTQYYYLVRAFTALTRRSSQSSAETAETAFLIGGLGWVCFCWSGVIIVPNARSAPSRKVPHHNAMQA